MADNSGVTILDKDSYDYFERRKSGLKNERQSFIDHYRELAEFIQPRRGRFLTQDRNKGDRRYSSIINSRASMAHFTARSGMLAGTCSPAMPWFALSTPDPDLNQYQPVKLWLYKMENLLRAILNGSNFYDQASTLLGELLLFATGVMTHMDDFEDVGRFYTHTAGSYMIAQNGRQQVDTLVREFEMTVGQMVAEYGLGNVSQAVKNAYDHSDYEKWYPVVHFIEPNPSARPGNPFLKAFRSVYYEPGNTGADRNKFLETKGYREFPAYVPRWETTNEDIYGTSCPAMIALGDIKGLQIEEKRKAQGIDKMVSPPLAGPASLRNVPIRSVPNGVTLYDGDQSSNGGLRALYQLQLRLDELRLDINAVEQRINEAFFVSLFQPITQMQGIQPKNQFELAQRTQEAMLIVGPVLERLHRDFLSRMIDRVFNQCVAARIIPIPPPELVGRPLKVDYISPLAMAQKQTSLGGIDRLTAYIGGLIGYQIPGAAEKFNAAAAIDEYAAALGTSPRLIVPDEVVQKQREEQAAMQQQDRQLAMVQAVAGAAKDGGAGLNQVSQAGATAAGAVQPASGQ